MKRLWSFLSEIFSILTFHSSGPLDICQFGGRLDAFFLPILWPRLIPGMEDILAAGEKPAMKLVDEVKREHFGLEDIGKPTSYQQSTVVNLEKKGLSSEQPIFVNAESKGTGNSDSSLSSYFGTKPTFAM